MASACWSLRGSLDGETCDPCGPERGALRTTVGLRGGFPSRTLQSGCRAAAPWPCSATLTGAPLGGLLPRWETQGSIRKTRGAENSTASVSGGSRGREDEPEGQSRPLPSSQALPEAKTRPRMRRNLQVPILVKHERVNEEMSVDGIRPRCPARPLDEVLSEARWVSQTRDRGSCPHHTPPKFPTQIPLGGKRKTSTRRPSPRGPPRSVQTALGRVTWLPVRLFG